MFDSYVNRPRVATTEIVREFTKIPRSEDQIREDMRQQLNAIYLKQQEKWKCP